MKNKQLNVGIAGYGVVGNRRRVSVDSHPHMHTVVVCDVRFNKDGTMIDSKSVETYGLLEHRAFDKPIAGTMKDGIHFCNNYRYLLENYSLDVLFVCLPTYLAHELTIAGLERGLHVFCEKPPGRTVEDVQKVIETEKKHPGLVLKYGFNHRYHDSVREALRIIKSGELGEIINLRGIYGKSKIIPFSGGWRADRKYAGGGILLDQGIHMVDLMQLFCGNFVEVKSYVSNRYWNHDVEDNAYVLMRDNYGRIAMLHSSATQWQHRFALDITLTEGYLELQGILSGSKSYGEEKLVIGRRDESDTGTSREEIVTYLEDNSWQDEIYEFGDAICNGGKNQSGTSQDALNTMELVYRIYGADPEWRKAYNINYHDEEIILA